MVEGHANSLTLDYSQYTDIHHASVTVVDFVGIDPSMNGLNLAGSNAATGPYTAIAIANPRLRRSRLQAPIAGGGCMSWACNATGNFCPGGTICTPTGDACCAPDGYATGNAINLGFVDGVQISGAQITGPWGVGVHFQGGAFGSVTPTSYEIDVDRAIIEGVDTAFAFALNGASFNRSTTRGVVVRKANATASGPGRAAAIARKSTLFAELREYEVRNPIGSSS